MAIGRELPIIGSYDKQRFLQFNPEDCANWYIVPNSNAKKKAAMYPTMGRRHLGGFGINKLVFISQPRALFNSVKYSYFVSGNIIYRADTNYNIIAISNSDFNKTSGNVFAAVLYTPNRTYVGFVDGTHLFIHTEETLAFSKITDSALEPDVTYIASLGNRFVVAYENSTQFNLSAINLGGTPFDPTSCFKVAGNAVFAQESGKIGQLAVNQNILYIFTKFTTGIWANIQSTISEPVSGQQTTFPFKKNTSYQFQYGIADPLSIDSDFGVMVWLGQTQSGLIQVVASSGEAPKPISTKAIDVLFQNSASSSGLSPFVEDDANGFLYQYENTIFYRISAGQYKGYEQLDIQTDANSIEYNFDTQTWSRVIELNGERNRIERHIYFGNKHLVTLQGDTTVYEMTGQVYTNDIRNPDQLDPQASDAYLTYPFRYERVTSIISEPDYAETITKWVQIDFVWGDLTYVRTTAPFANAQYIVDENGTFLTDENGAFLLVEGSNTPVVNSPTYFALFKPSIELYFSDDGGITYNTADVLQFSDLGVYSWRMRWYQLGCSRNRVYKLICVSPAPIVILGGWQLTERVSNGAA